MEIFEEQDVFVSECRKNFVEFDQEQFQTEFKRLKYIKKLLCKYERSGTIKERLLLNHIIILYNNFNDFASYMLFFHIERKHWKTLITFLIYLNRINEKLPFGNLYVSDIGLDNNIVDILRKL